MSVLVSVGGGSSVDGANGKDGHDPHDHPELREGPSVVANCIPSVEVGQAVGHFFLKAQLDHSILTKSTKPLPELALSW